MPLRERIPLVEAELDRVRDLVWETDGVSEGNDVVVSDGLEEERALPRFEDEADTTIVVVADAMLLDV